MSEPTASDVTRFRFDNEAGFGQEKKYPGGKTAEQMAQEKFMHDISLQNTRARLNDELYQSQGMKRLDNGSEDKWFNDMHFDVNDNLKPKQRPIMMNDKLPPGVNPAWLKGEPTMSEPSRWEKIKEYIGL